MSLWLAVTSPQTWRSIGIQLWTVRFRGTIAHSVWADDGFGEPVILWQAQTDWLGDYVRRDV